MKELTNQKAAFAKVQEDLESQIIELASQKEELLLAIQRQEEKHDVELADRNDQTDEMEVFDKSNQAVAESADQESQIIESDIPTDESPKTQNSSVNVSKASSKTSSNALSEVSSVVVSRAPSKTSSKTSSIAVSKVSSVTESTADLIAETIKQAMEEASEEQIEEEEAVPEDERPVYRSKISLKQRDASFTSYIP